jgi:tetratricopeptide (TPR) repeat protein
MKRYFALLLVSFCALAGIARADSLDDQYVAVFNVIQEADGLNGTDPKEALAKYQEAQAALQRIQKADPNWNTLVVSFRLEYLAGKIASLSAGNPPTGPGTPATAGTNQPSPAQVTTTNAAAPAPPSSAPAAPAAPADWEEQMNGLHQQISQLQAANGNLEAKLKEAFAARPAEADPAQLAKLQDRVKALEKENDLLKVTLQQQKAAPPAAGATAATAPSPATPSAANSAGLEKALAEANRDRDELRRQLQQATKAAGNRKPRNEDARLQELQLLLDTANVRLAAYEARRVPYTKDELALLNATGPKLPAPEKNTGRMSIKQLSPAAAQLVSEARKSYQAGQLDKAEADYEQVLQEDPKSVSVLADLANIQLAANHLTAADKNITQAAALAPESPYVLSVIGRVRMQQERYDEALDALSRAAKLEPDNAEIQNFLGLALSHKGMRVPAENALRRAVELEPNYAQAHENLAVSYATGKPPALALARWHYQRALDSGASPSPGLEKLLAAKP